MSGVPSKKGGINPEDNENQPIYRVLRPDQLVMVKGETVLVSLVRIQNIPKTTFGKELLLEILRASKEDPEWLTEKAKATKGNPSPILRSRVKCCIIKADFMCQINWNCCGTLWLQNTIV